MTKSIKLSGWVLALVLAPVAALAQAVAPLPVPGEAPVEQVLEESQPPAIDLSVPADTRPEAPAQQPDGAAMQKIREVAAELDKAQGNQPQTQDMASYRQKGEVSTLESVRWSPKNSALKAVFGLTMALALLLLLGYLARRFGKNSPLFAGADLARVMGKVYLSPKASLHFVRVNDKVLVVGVTQNSVSRVAEFDADAFQTLPEESAQPAGSATAGAESETDSFLNQFKASLENIAKAVPAETVEESDAGISALREDVERLQQYLQESVREDNR